jgi:uncharacterized protein YjbI with pentapeptide repeats
MTKEQLVERWKTEGGKALLKQATECLTSGAPLSLLSGIEKYAGRWDLRGAQLSVIKDEIRIKSGGHGVTQKFGSLKLKEVKIESVDLSYADISCAWLEDCNIENCIFENTKGLELRIYGSVFSKCVFRKANLSYSYISNLGANAGMFKQVEFIECNLSTCLFSFPIIDGCLFASCDLREVDFDGSRMRNCKFKGQIDSAWFRGYSINARKKSVLGIFNRIDPKSFPNLMEHVDFSESELLGVTFSHGIDLSQCIFPADESRYIVVNNLPSVYSKVRKIIESEWAGEEKRIGIGFIDTIFFKQDRQDQKMDLIDKSLLSDNGTDQRFGDKFFNLIKEVNSMNKVGHAP